MVPVPMELEKKSHHILQKFGISETPLFSLKWWDRGHTEYIIFTFNYSYITASSLSKQVKLCL